MTAWTLWALRCGHSTVDQSTLTYLEDPGKSVVIPHVMFLAIGPANVLVDTSFRSAATVRAAYPQDIHRASEEEPVGLLAQLNLKPSDVEIIIHTHLHYDHAGNDHLFPRVRPRVQRVEIDYAFKPSVTIMQREYFAPSAGFEPPFDATTFSEVTGDSALMDGLDLLLLPGHTPGSQGVLFQTRNGPVCIPGDQVMVRENMRADKPVGLHTDLEAWERSHKRLTELHARIVPTHDMRIFEGGSIQRLTK